MKPDSPAKPDRPRRMFAWLVALPAALLLLAFAGANWRVFHLAYCKGLMRSDSLAERDRGLRLLYEQKHLARDMSREDLDAMLDPLKATDDTQLFNFTPPAPKDGSLRVLSYIAGERNLVVLLREERLACAQMLIQPSALHIFREVKSWNTSSPQIFCVPTMPVGPGPKPFEVPAPKGSSE